LLVDGAHADGPWETLWVSTMAWFHLGMFSKSVRNPTTSSIGLLIITVFSKVATRRPSPTPSAHPLEYVLPASSASAAAGTSEPNVLS
jgi:hypothetical protein